MQVLLRKDYKWHDVEFNPDTNVIYNDTYGSIYDTHIVAVKDDERLKYLQCSACGELILNTPEDIARHISIKDSWEQCPTCKNCRRKHIETEQETLHPVVSDSRFIIESRDVYELVCGSWNEQNIFSNGARMRCKFRNCTTETLSVCDSAFIHYPDLFDTMATIDTLEPDRWKYEKYISTHGYIYKLNARTNLYVTVNSTGIIDRFEYVCRSNSQYCYYSKKYDKLFWGSNYYDENRPSFVAENIEKSILREVRKIYGGNEE